MYKYLYLCLALIIASSSAIIFFLRKDLRVSIAMTAAIGAAWGPLSEVWFYRDYWRPRGALTSRPWLEDVVYGAGVLSLAAVTYVFVCHRAWRGRGIQPSRTLLVAALPVLYVTAMVSTRTLHVNSIIVACIVYVVGTLIMVGLRHDLLLPAIGSAAIMSSLAVVGYFVGLDLIVDGKEVLDRFWLLNGKPLGIKVLGQVPLTEVIWYGTWGAMGGCVVPFLLGAKVSGSGPHTAPPNGRNVIERTDATELRRGSDL
jgi:hypothetical protein